MTSRSDFARRQRIKPSRSGVEMRSPDWRKTRLPLPPPTAVFVRLKTAPTWNQATARVVAVRQGDPAAAKIMPSLVRQESELQMHKLICS